MHIFSKNICLAISLGMFYRYHVVINVFGSISALSERRREYSVVGSNQELWETNDGR